MPKEHFIIRPGTGLHKCELRLELNTVDQSDRNRSKQILIMSLQLMNHTLRQVLKK